MILTVKSSGCLQIGVKFVKKSGGNNFVLHCDFRFLKTFLGSQKKKKKKCLMGLFDTSKDAHFKKDFKNM